MGERRYEQVIKFVVETPWAIRPYMLETIRAVLAAKINGAELEPYAAAPRQQAPSPGSVAVLPLWGVMVPHAGMMTDFSGGTAMDTWMEDFRTLVNDPSISTIVLDIDSPGGAVSFVPEAAAEVRKSKKRVVAVANPEAGSAAYWIASAADELFVPVSGQVGSIGVLAEHTDTSRMDEQEGVTRTLVTAGEYKGEQWGPLSDEARAAIQYKVDQYYSMFVADVAKGRNVTAGVVEKTYGQGRMLTARDALAVGMVDRIGTLDDAISRELPAGKPKAVTRAEDADTDVVVGLVLDGAEITQAIYPNQSQMIYPNQITATSGTTNYTVSVASPPGPVRGEEGAAARGAETDTKKETVMDEEREYKTLEELAARVDEVTSRMSEIHADAQGRQFTDEEQEEFDSLDRERLDREEAISNIKEREKRLQKALAEGSVQTGDGAVQLRDKRVHTAAGARLPDNVFDLTAYRGYARSMDDLAGLYREGAMRVAETLRYETDDTDRAAKNVETLLNRDGRNGEFAQRILTAGSPLYDRAFGKLIRNQPLSSQEDAAIKAAVSNTGLGNETPVPVTIDPTVILTSDGQVNPLRAISRTVTITGNTWQGISSDGVEVAYEAELTQVADQTPIFEAPVATVAKAHAYVEFSIEVDQDWGELRSNLAMMFQDAKDAKEAEKFLYGSGTNEPFGLITGLTAAGPPTVQTTATLNTFDIADVYSLRGSLPPRWRSRAVWLANDDIYSVIRQADEAGGSSLWVQLAADRPALLLGKPIYEASEMSGEFDQGGEFILIYGDFSRGFIIVDRVGMNVELIPHVLGANRRPIGARALYAYFRNTSQLLVANAFRMLEVKPT